MKRETIDKIIKFRDDRNWKQFHTPENLAKSISIEANELLELFQWSSDSEKIESIKDELADILSYVILFSEHYGFDLDEIVLNKMKKNEIKYPISKAYNNSKKYTDL